jgi:hypothetical protein
VPENNPRKASKPFLAEIPTLSTQRRDFANYVTSCIAGRPHPKSLYATTEQMTPGTRVRASDRDYVVHEDGSFRRTSVGPSNLSRSQIYAPVKPAKNDKYGNLRLTE